MSEGEYEDFELSFLDLLREVEMRAKAGESFTDERARLWLRLNLKHAAAAPIKESQS